MIRPVRSQLLSRHLGSDVGAHDAVELRKAFDDLHSALGDHRARSFVSGLERLLERLDEEGLALEARAQSSYAELRPSVDAVLRAAKLEDLVGTGSFDEAKRALETAAKIVRETLVADEGLRGDLRRARELQHGMLVPRIEAQQLAFEHEYRPLDDVGGDFFDVARLSETTVRLFIADVAGHGIRAALSTMLLKSEYESLKRTSEKPRDLLFHLNEVLVRNYPSRSLVLTGMCLDLDPSTGEFVYASGAHPGPMRIGRDAAVLESGGSFLGVSKRTELVTQTGRLEPGESLYLVTDGVLEACAPSGEMYGEDRALATLLESHGGPLSRAKALVDGVLGFLENTKANDDIAILGVRFLDGPRPAKSHTTR